MEGLPKLTDDIASKTSQWNQAQWQKVIRAHLGINLLTQEPWLIDQLKSFTNQNVQLVTKLAEETRADIERIISDGYQRGLRVENIRGKLLSESKLTPGRFKKTRTRANLISRDQVGKLNGQLTQIRQTEADIEQYWWNTVIDERVRTSHMAMNGKLCRWDNATVYKDFPNDPGWKARSSIGGIELHPGQDYQCRCFAEPDFSTVFPEELRPVIPARPPGRAIPLNKKIRSYLGSIGRGTISPSKSVFTKRIVDLGGNRVMANNLWRSVR